MRLDDVRNDEIRKALLALCPISNLKIDRFRNTKVLNIYSKLKVGGDYIYLTLFIPERSPGGQIVDYVKDTIDRVIQDHKS